MARYHYNVISSGLWSSFSFGEVEAESLEEATALATERLEEDFKKANEALAYSDNTYGFTLSFDEGNIEVEEVAPEID